MHRFVTAVAVFVSGVVSAPASAVELNQLIRDTQQSSPDAQKVGLVWWIPTVFWATVLEQQPGMTQQAREEFTTVLEDYTIFVVISGRIGPFGGMNLQPREKILESFEFRIGPRTLPPLGDDEVSADARNFFAAMKPMMANMLGDFGKGMEFVAFTNRGDDGAKLIDPAKEGAFEVRLDGETYRWRLPLGSLLPAKIDPDTGEEFPGNYNFSPYTGRKLVEK